MGDYQDPEEMEVHVEEESQEEDVFPEVVQEKVDLGSYLSSLFFDHWFLWLIFAVTFVYIYRRYIAPAIERYMHHLADKELEAKLSKNPDLLRARQEAMLEARRRMQEKHDAEAARMEELRIQREEKKKQEMLTKNSGIYARAGYILDDSADPRKQNKPSTRPNRSDYNPLMGSGSSSGGYRPPRRSCPGGGCG